MSLLTYALSNLLEDELTQEGRDFIAAQNSSGYSLYVLLTDTQTQFSKLSKYVTNEPYNHISLMFDDSFKEIYTYALTSPDNGFRGGFKEESVDVLKGSRYSLYKVDVSKDAWQRVKEKVEELSERRKETSYNFRSLVNFIFKKNLFENTDELRMICSEFVLHALEIADIKIKKAASGIMTPYEIVKHKALEHVRRGTIK